MEFSFDRVVDALYLKFSHERIISSEEIAKGIIVAYGKDENILGIEILNFSKRRLNLNEIIHLSIDETYSCDCSMLIYSSCISSNEI